MKQRTQQAATRTRALRYWCGGWIVAVGSLSAGCAGKESDVRAEVTRHALTAVQERILGFETPTADWSATGATLGASSTASKGASAASLVLGGYTEVVSVPVATLGAVSPTVSYDIRLPEAVSWGETRLVLRIPSQGVWWADLGGHSLVGLAAGTYHTMSFTVPASLLTTLGATYSDLEFRVIVNGPAFTAPYLLDNLAFGTVPGGGTNPTSLSVSLTIPQGMAFGSLHMVGQDSLTLTDRVKGPWSGVTFGNAQLGPDAAAQALLVDQTLTLADRATVATAKARAVSAPAGAIGQLRLLTGVTPVENIGWEVLLPIDVEPPVALFTGTLAPPPGRFAALHVYPGATLQLAAGTYFTDELTVESDGWLLPADNHDTVVYVLNSLTMHGKVGSPGELGGFAIVYLGTGAATIERSLNGVLVAPNADVRLATPPAPTEHVGAFFSKNLLVSPDVTLKFVPPNILVPLFAGDKQTCIRHLGMAPGSRLAWEMAMARYCGGATDLCAAELTSRANVDSWTAATRLTMRDFTPARYVAVSRDRTRKLTRSRSLPDYACQVQAADADHDLVPDSEDNCPATPLLTPTDEHGCETPIPPGPDPETVGVLIDGMHLATSKHCLNAAVPAAPVPVRFARVGLGPMFAFQSLGPQQECRVYYEIELQRRSATGYPGTASSRFVAAPGRHIILSDTTDCFYYEPDLAGGHSADPLSDHILQFVSDSTAYYRFRARAINAIGVSSGYGAWSNWYLPED